MLDDVDTSLPACRACSPEHIVPGEVVEDGAANPNSTAMWKTPRRRRLVAGEFSDVAVGALQTCLGKRVQTPARSGGGGKRVRLDHRSVSVLRDRELGPRKVKLSPRAKMSSMYESED